MERFNGTIQEQFINWNLELLNRPQKFAKAMIGWLLWYNLENALEYKEQMQQAGELVAGLRKAIKDGQSNQATIGEIDELADPKQFAKILTDAVECFALKNEKGVKAALGILEKYPNTEIGTNKKVIKLLAEEATKRYVDILITNNINEELNFTLL